MLDKELVIALKKIREEITEDIQKFNSRLLTQVKHNSDCKKFRQEV